MPYSKQKLAVSNGFGFMALAISVMLLFNGNINIIDPLPDIIAYIVINFALSKLALIDEDVLTSQKYFRYMIISEIAKFGGLIWILGVSGNDEKNTGVLLLTFVFAIIDSTLLFVAFSKLFDGLTSLAYLAPSSYVLSSKKENGASHTDKIKKFTLFFVLFKAVITVLPEFSNLTSYDGAEGSRVSFLYEFIGLMRGMSIFAVSVVGIVFAIKIFRYFNKISKDADFIAALSEKYSKEVLPKRGIFVKRNFSAAIFFLFCYALLYADFRVTNLTLLPSELGYFSPDMTNIIPDFISAIFFFVSMSILSKYVKISKLSVYLSSAFYFVASAFAFASELSFFDNYYYGAVFKSEKAYMSYIVMTVASIVAVISFCVTVAFVVYALGMVIRTHTGFAYGVDIEKDRERVLAQHRETGRKLIYIVVGAFFAVATKLFYIFFAKDFGFAGTLQVIGTLIFLACTVKACHDISDEIETKYMLE